MSNNAIAISVLILPGILQWTAGLLRGVDLDNRFPRWLQRLAGDTEHFVEHVGVCVVIAILLWFVAVTAINVYCVSVGGFVFDPVNFEVVEQQAYN